MMVEWTIASSIPGRLRIRLSRPIPARQMEALRARADAIQGVMRTEANPRAASLLVQYARRLPQEQMQVLVAAALRRPLSAEGRALAARQPSIDDRGGALSRQAPVPGRFTAGGQLEVRTALDMAARPDSGMKPLITPTIAVALAAIEVLPVAVVGAALAAAALPIARRANTGFRSRRLTVDQLDLANVALLSLGGQYLVAAVVSWLISFGEMARASSVRRARLEIGRLHLASGGHAAAPGLQGAARERETLELLLHAPLADAALQKTAVGLSHSAAAPTVGLAAVFSALARDPSAFIDIAKPRTDFSFGQGFSIPATMLNAMTATIREGPLFTSARAIEKMAALDSVVVAAAPPRNQARLDTLREELASCGIRALIFVSRSNLVVELAPHRLRLELEQSAARSGSAIADRLASLDYHPALVSDARRSLTCGPDVTRVLVDPRGEVAPDGYDVLLLIKRDSEVARAILHARRAMRTARQNTAIGAAAAATNFVAGLLRMAPAPVSSLINAASIAAVGINASSVGPGRRRP